MVSGPGERKAKFLEYIKSFLAHYFLAGKNGSDTLVTGLIQSIPAHCQPKALRLPSINHGQFLQTLLNTESS